MKATYLFPIATLILIVIFYAGLPALRVCPRPKKIEDEKKGWRSHWFILALTLLYTVVAFVNLGNLRSPQTYRDFDDGETAIVFMGHGTNHEANGVYAEMQDIIRKEAGNDNYFVGVVHDGAKPDVNDVLAEVKKNDAFKKVVLRDMMVVAGDHANNDMADANDPESWYSTFKAAGYEVETVLEGLGQIEDIQEMYVDHCEDAVEKINAK